MREALQANIIISAHHCSKFVLYEGQQLLQIRVSSTSHHNSIINNIFEDFNYEDPPDHRGNGYETIQIRDGSSDQGDGFNIVEGNYFKNLNTEAEVISVKSRFNIIKGNAFDGNQGK